MIESGCGPGIEQYDCVVAEPLTKLCTPKPQLALDLYAVAVGVVPQRGDEATYRVTCSSIKVTNGDRASAALLERGTFEDVVSADDPRSLLSCVARVVDALEYAVTKQRENCWKAGVPYGKVAFEIGEDTRHPVQQTPLWMSLFGESTAQPKWRRDYESMVPNLEEWLDKGAELYLNSLENRAPRFAAEALPALTDPLLQRQACDSINRILARYIRETYAVEDLPHPERFLSLLNKAAKTLPEGNRDIGAQVMVRTMQIGLPDGHPMKVYPFAQILRTPYADLPQQQQPRARTYALCRALQWNGHSDMSVDGLDALDRREARYARVIAGHDAASSDKTFTDKRDRVCERLASLLDDCVFQIGGYGNPEKVKVVKAAEMNPSEFDEKVLSLKRELDEGNFEAHDKLCDLAREQGRDVGLGNNLEMRFFQFEVPKGYREDPAAQQRCPRYAFYQWHPDYSASFYAGYHEAYHGTRVRHFKLPLDPLERPFFDPAVDLACEVAAFVNGELEQAGRAGFGNRHRRTAYAVHDVAHERIRLQRELRARVAKQRYGE